MCLIIVSETGTQDINRDDVLSSCATNRDGFGVVWLDYGLKTVEVYRTLDVEAYLAKVDTIPEDSPVILHQRFATQGTVSDANVHPFTIETKAGPVYIAHNGCIDTPPHLPKGWSDTRWLLQGVIGPAMRYACKSKAQSAIDLIEALDTSSRWAAMDSHGRIAIGNEHLGDYIGGAWYSNLYSVGWSVGTGRYGAWDDEDWGAPNTRLADALDRMPIDGYGRPAAKPTLRVTATKKKGGTSGP